MADCHCRSAYFCSDAARSDGPHLRRPHASRVLGLEEHPLRDSHALHTESVENLPLVRRDPSGSHLWLLPPAGILYGKPSILVAIALMQTTPAETREFLMNTPWQLFAEAIGFIFAGLAAVHFFGQVKIPRKTGFVTGLAACAIAWFMSYGSGKTYEQIQTASFFHSFGTTMWYSAEELREEANALPPSWQVTSAEPQYKTYVVIIGESQRRDYASVYGYPLDTTPYLNRATALSSATSLPRAAIPAFRSRACFPTTRLAPTATARKTTSSRSRILRASTLGGYRIRGAAAPLTIRLLRSASEVITRSGLRGTTPTPTWMTICCCLRSERR